MNKILTALYIPANTWRPVVEYGIAADDNGVHLQTVRDLLDVRMVEVINPTEKSKVAPDGPLGWHAALGDEEARFVEGNRPNPRATLLLGYPYMIVGDVILLGDSINDQHERRFTSIDPTLLESLQTNH